MLVSPYVQVVSLRLQLFLPFSYLNADNLKLAFSLLGKVSKVTAWRSFLKKFKARIFEVV